MSTTQKLELEDYVPVIVIGAGISGVCMGVQLQTQLGFRGFHIYEEQREFGGTWAANVYPGCACDIPSALYSYSFAQKPDWSALLPPQHEILEYVTSVAKSYGVDSHTTFRTRCVSAVWDVDNDRWVVTLQDLDSGRTFRRPCAILVSAVGGLSAPKPASETADFSSFEGAVFHSARWDHTVDLQDKDVVVIGNGCSASQFVPVIAPQTRSLTQIIRSPHWIFPGALPYYTPTIRWLIEHIPFGYLAFRFLVFLVAEINFGMFFMDAKGERLRTKLEAQSRKYILEAAPEKYHDVLTPKYPMGCKRRIFDSRKYLESLHGSNISLQASPILEVLPRAVRTEAGTHPADVVVLATGFETNSFVPLDVVGRDNLSLRDHWASLGGPGAYDSIACAGFPNFVMLLGANWATGHTSTIMAIENSTNLAIKLMQPILQDKASTFEVKAAAETEYVNKVQKDLRGTVWAGCRNWYASPDGWNGTLYPWSQVTFWWRCRFPHWNAWVYSK
ncbi:4-hydroxyacetophenone monooxygenase [Exidia glandulosa HHB12029]|uniref:4-hydroxyacetophenone monooxygenase n=1 Tax=Exidia glandulosa HHB12029 TaxID=1314781 RepID=A0A165HPH3_EXIGL|nr:4-hydroxyacetophenone monooxygenase [Exidia glandulosa HHB12029]